MIFTKILVVCTGNICRSPVGQALLQQQCRQTVKSAGLNVLINNKIDATALALAKERNGIDLSHHRARQIDAAMIESANLILVMTARQRRAVANILPTVSGKTLLFGQWLNGEQGEDIPDPFQKSFSAFEHVHNKLVLAAEHWCKKLR